MQGRFKENFNEMKYLHKYIYMFNLKKIKRIVAAACDVVATRHNLTNLFLNW